MRISGRALTLRALMAALLIGAGALALPGHASAHTLTVNPPQLSPTFPGDTGKIATTAVGQDTGVFWSFDYPSTWQTSSNVEVYVVSVANVTSPGACSQAAGATRVFTDQATGSGIENLSLGFTWPASATIAAGGQYYAICLHPTNSTSAGSDMYTYDGGTLDNNNTTVYRVLNDASPTARVSATTVYVGQTLTVTGSNWKYYYYPDLANGGTSVLLVQYPTTQTYNYAATVKPQVDPNTGDFTVQLQITEAPGTYYVCVGNAFFKAYAVGGGIKVQVLSGGAPATGGTGGGGGTSVAAATATPRATGTAATQPQATRTLSSVTAAGGIGDNTRSTGSRPNSGGTITWFGSIGLALMALAGVVFFYWRRRALTSRF